MKYEIEGKWRKGYALDLHTLASTYLGTDQYGHGRFENTRSEIGELVYQLKYQNDKAAVPKIIALLGATTGIDTFDAIIPVPSSNKNRAYQPVDEIAKALGESRKVPVLVGFLEKVAVQQLKNVDDAEKRQELLEGAITVAGSENIAGKKVLLVDDLFRSGATLNACCTTLLGTAKVADICAITMTKTRSNR